MDYKTMTVDELMERRSAIANEIDLPEADLDALEAEARAINDELEARKQAETKRNEIRNAVAHGEGNVTENFEHMEGRKTMTEKEIRSSKEYINAYANYCKTGDDAECRALLTENVESPLVGNVPVPVMVEGIMAEALKESPIMRRVMKTYSRGNVKVGFEINAPAAAVHEEGGDPVEEEELTLGIVTLPPATLKKWVSISDEALDTMSGEDYLRYLYNEVARGIIKTEENLAVSVILSSPATATATAPGVPVRIAAQRSLADFINARALLSSDAGDLVIIMKPTDYAAYKALAIGAGFAFDPFEGIEVLFNDTATAPIIGDLSGILANYPNGDNVQFKRDDLSLMTSDLVRILGRKPVAIGVVRDKFFAKITVTGGSI